MKIYLQIIKLYYVNLLFLLNSKLIASLDIIKLNLQLNRVPNRCISILKIMFMLREVHTWNSILRSVDNSGKP